MEKRSRKEGIRTHWNLDLARLAISSDPCGPPATSRFWTYLHFVLVVCHAVVNAWSKSAPIFGQEDSAQGEGTEAVQLSIFVQRTVFGNIGGYRAESAKRLPCQPYNSVHAECESVIDRPHCFELLELLVLGLRNINPSEDPLASDFRRFWPRIPEPTSSRCQTLIDEKMRGIEVRDGEADKLRGLVFKKATSEMRNATF
jgi:hypothetical protein